MSLIVTFILSFIFNMILVLFGAFLVSFTLMLILNPTASSKEIFEYWKKNFKGEV